MVLLKSLIQTVHGWGYSNIRNSDLILKYHKNTEVNKNKFNDDVRKLYDEFMK